MNKTVKWSLIAIIGAIVIGLIALFSMKAWTKSYSPEETLVFTKADLRVEIFYNRPYKNGRTLFGGLVPYNQVWRTGANEATTFTINKDIYVDGSLLKAGKYSLWTIPKKESWEIIFNSKMYPWGITMEGKPSREPAFDVLKLEVPAMKNYKTIEQFTVYFNKGNPLNYIFLAWGNVVVPIPFKEAE